MQSPNPKEIDTIEVRFSLSQAVPIHGLSRVKDLKFILTQKDGKDYLSEIIAITSGKNVDESISIMTEKVRRLCNLISYKCKKGYIPIYHGYLIKYKNGLSKTVRYRYRKVIYRRPNHFPGNTT
jgi:hypothetical protein